MDIRDLARLAVPSFRLDGRASAEFLDSWPYETRPEGARSETVRTDPATGLKVTIRLRRFDDSPALDWVAEFENRGASDTPVIEAILPLDVTLPLPPDERLRLHHANGSSCRADDFLPFITELPAGSVKTLTPVGGRSSNGVLPFMNFQGRGGGFVLAIGWSGQWSATVERGRDGLRLAAGMDRTRLRLRPGERIRTPRILVLPWQGGDPEEGNNLLRRLLLAHYLPRIAGELVMPPAAHCLQGYLYLTGKASEEYEMKTLPQAADLGVEAHWIDACWYGGEGDWSQEVGSWTVNRNRFPHGLKPISDAAHRAGMKFVLWFEPERARAGSLIRREHPDFLLSRSPDEQVFLLNLGMPAAREFITDLLSRGITEHGVDIYRQDFNMNPLPYWQAADAPDRVGMTEIRYVEGLYALWDELRRRHPNVWIDNCSSGGRRIDLETVSRSLPLWPSDFPDVGGLRSGLGQQVGDQCINAGLARWVSLFGGGVWSFTPYATRSELIAGFTFGFHIDQRDMPDDEADTLLHWRDVLRHGKTLLDADFPREAARQAIAEWRSVRQFFTGDFHLLLPLTASAHDWCAWQFHREDLQAGIAVFFRRHRNAFPRMEAALKRVVADAEYEVSLSAGYAESPRRRMRGERLLRLSIEIPDAPGSVLVRYQRAPRV